MRLFGSLTLLITLVANWRLFFSCSIMAMPQNNTGTQCPEQHAYGWSHSVELFIKLNELNSTGFKPDQLRFLVLQLRGRLPR